MQVKFNCSYCHAKIGAEDEFCGMAVQCPGCDRNITVPSARFGSGEQLGGYRIDQFLGNGAMGEVYLATQLSMDRPVALKIISKHAAEDEEDEEDRERFAREIRLLAKLNHQNIVTAFEAGEHEGCQFLAMGFIDGQALDERLDREKMIPEADALDICLKVAEALKYAWERFGLLHRDIKPANIMIDRYGEVKLMDMGIAKTASEESSATMTGMVIGTPYYMSPEQARAREDLDFRSDMYGLGATLYHLVTGEYSHTGANPMEVLTRKLSDPVKPARKVNPKVSEGCEALLAQILQIDAEARPQTWDIVIERMKRVRHGKMPIRSTNTHSSKRRKMRVGTPTAPTLSREEIAEVESEVEALQKKKPITGILIAVFVAIIAAIAAVALLGGGNDGDPKPGTQPSAVPVAGTEPGGSTADDAAAAAAAAKKKKKAEAEAAKRAQADKKKRVAQAAKVLEQAEAFYRENPNDLYGAMDAFQKAVSVGEGTSVAKKAYQRVQELRGKRDQFIEHVMAYVGYNMHMALLKNDIERAVSRSRNYDGIMASETAGLRDDLADGLSVEATEEEKNEVIRKIKEYAVLFKAKFQSVKPSSGVRENRPDSSRPVAPEATTTPTIATKPAKTIGEIVKEKLEKVSLDVGNAVIRNDFDKAKQVLKGEIAKAPPFPKAVYSKLLSRVSEVAKMPDRVIDGLLVDKGKKVTIQFSRGPETFILQEVSQTEIKGYLEVKAGSSVGRLGKRYRVADLNASEYLKRLEMSGTSELNVMRGLMAVRLRRFDVADSSFEAAGGMLGNGLRAALLPLAPSLKESAALNALREMLRDLGVSSTSDPDQVRAELGVDKLSDQRLAEIRATATAMRDKYDDTALVREQKPLLDMLCNLTKMVWPVAQEKVVLMWDAALPDDSGDLTLRGDAKIIPGQGVVVGAFGGAILERRKTVSGGLMAENGMTMEFAFKRDAESEQAGQLISFESEDDGALGVFLKGNDLTLEIRSGDTLKELPIGSIRSDSAHVAVAIDRENGTIRAAVNGKVVLDAAVAMDAGSMRRTKLVLGATRRDDRPWAGAIDNVLFYSDVQTKPGFYAHYRAWAGWRKSNKKD